MAAKVEVIAERRRLPIGFGRVGEENRDLSLGNGGPCLLQIMGAEEVRIIDSADPEP
jgi:hypothetical protein